MEISQRPGQAEDSPGHRWAGILGTGVAVVTLILPLVMIASYTPFSSNAQPVSQSNLSTSKCRTDSNEIIKNCHATGSLLIEASSDIQ